jgi:eukaryotic-like serine/threonine-protein kinase
MEETDRARWAKASALFDQLADCTTGERAERLAELARLDPALEREVASLLAADVGATRAGEESLVDAARAAARDLAEHRSRAGDSDAVDAEVPASGAPGMLLDDYRLLHPLGQGGMGEVWEAERADGLYEQRVAVKLLKRGLDSAQLVSRFARERQILARLEHPGITRLLDGGVTPEGRPYLVMERVEGQPITTYVTERRLPVRARVELMVAVADAVAAAHRALVIHRDLKPSNILVEASGKPRLLDFGVAKLVDADDPLLTAYFATPFTPAYAAPEQIAGGAIGVAADVYSLGVVFYELLAGQRPFERQGRHSAELLAEVQAEEEVTRPSRMRTAGAPLIDADLDAIALKALRTEPADRYRSAATFADDLRRYLAGEPVEARGGAFAYRARKLVRRHRLAAGAAAVVVLALVGGAAMAFWQAARATREAERARRVEGFLVDIFAQADPSQTSGQRLSARQVLDQGAARIERELAAEPGSRASLEEALSRSYRGLGLFTQARTHAEHALALRRSLGGRGSRDEAVATVTLVEVMLDQGELAAAAARIDPALARLRREDAEPGDLLRALTARSSLALQAGDYDRARALDLEIFERTRALYGDDSLEAAQAMQERALTLSTAGEVQQAATLLGDALGRMERSGQGANPLAGVMHTNLADLLDTAGRSAEAERHFRAGLELEERGWGKDHPEVAQTLLKYGVFLVGRRRYSEADVALVRAEKILAGLGHYDLANAWRYLGYSALGRERYDEAERWFVAAEAKLRKEMGDDHPLTWAAVVPLAQTKAKLGQLEEAERMQREAVAALVRLHGAESDEVRVPMKNLGETLRRRGKVEEAIAIHRRVLGIERKLYGGDGAPSITATKRLLALDLLERPTPDGLREARELLDASIGYLRATPAEAGRLPELLETSGRVALAAGDRERARRDLGEAVELWAADSEPDPHSAAAARRTLAELARRRSVGR